MHRVRMQNDIIRRCYLCMITLAAICLLALMYTTKIIHISTLDRLHSLCTSKLKIKAWLEQISNKQDLTNIKLYGDGNDNRAYEAFKKFGSLTGKTTNNFKITLEKDAAKGYPLIESIHSQQRKYDKDSSLEPWTSNKLDEFSEKISEYESVEDKDRRTNDRNEKREAEKPSRESMSEIPANLASTPLRFRKYGDSWLMTKEELLLLKNWCVERDYRVNWKRILDPCKDKTVWSKNKPYWIPSNVTTAWRSFIQDTDIRPTGQYSRIFIQSVSQDGTMRQTGGDSWRVHIRGAANVPATIVDHSNGVYEVSFLITEPGEYSAKIVLDYTLCDGMKDPPVDWFIKGNSQGKYQHPDALPGNEHPYLLEEIPNGISFTVKSGRTSVLEEMKENGLLQKYCPNPQCMIWDGFGAWAQNTWTENLPTRRERGQTDYRDGTLWIFGDSVGDLFFKSISKRALCHEVFSNCNHTYNWVYSLKNMNTTQAKVEWDDKDFSIDRVIAELDNVLSDRSMNDRSAIIINMGLHYVQGINFTSYSQLIQRTIDLLSSHKNSPHGFHGKVIWKTTTALFKERYGDPKTGARHAKGLRFLTVQRLQLFNAYATSLMCNSGIDVLDVYPISDSYPGGTGGGAKPWDAVHFNAKAFQPVEDLLEEYLG